MKGKIALIAGGPAVDESLLPAMGDETLGTVSPLIYSGALDTPANRKFVKDYRAKFGKVPSYFAETNYTSGRWINEAVKTLNGNVEDREALLAALRKVEIPDAVRGPVKLDAVRQPDPERVHPQDRAQQGRRAAEHGDPHDPRGLAVLEVRRGRVPEAAGLQPRLPAVQGVLSAA